MGFEGNWRIVARIDRGEREAKRKEETRKDQSNAVESEATCPSDEEQDSGRIRTAASHRGLVGMTLGGRGGEIMRADYEVDSRYSS